jgi:hypothetical protein
LLETAIGFSSWTSAQWLADHEEREDPRFATNPQRMQNRIARAEASTALFAPHALC